MRIKEARQKSLNLQALRLYEAKTGEDMHFTESDNAVIILDKRITELEEILDDIVNNEFPNDFRFKKARQILNEK